MGLEGMKALFDDNGIKHVEAEFLGDWFETGYKRVVSDRIRKDLLEAAAVLGARDIKGSGQMYGEKVDIPHYAAELANWCDEAKSIGADIAIEVFPSQHYGSKTSRRKFWTSQGRKMADCASTSGIWREGASLTKRLVGSP